MCAELNLTPDELRAASPETSLLTRISNLMVSAQKEHFGRGPERTKSYLVDDLLFIVMRGGVTQAEQTMLDFGRHDLVRAFRQEFENEMTRKLVTAIEGVTGRRVLTYQSQILFDPHLVVQVFVFDGPVIPPDERDGPEGPGEAAPEPG